jgi:hypothetical protein
VDKLDRVDLKDLKVQPVKPEPLVKQVSPGLLATRATRAIQELLAHKVRQVFAVK